MGTEGSMVKRETQNIYTSPLSSLPSGSCQMYFKVSCKMNKVLWWGTWLEVTVHGLMTLHFMSLWELFQDTFLQCVHFMLSWLSKLMESWHSHYSKWIWKWRRMSGSISFDWQGITCHFLIMNNQQTEDVLVKLN